MPGPLVVAVASTLAVWGLGMGDGDVAVVGEAPRGLPRFSLPRLDAELFGALLPTATIVALVGFVESISVAKALAAKERYKVEPNAEFRALGLANVSAALFSGFPMAGSFSWTAVRYQSGARTQAASVATAIVVLLTLLFLTPLFYFLPLTALAAIILVAVWWTLPRHGVSSASGWQTVWLWS